MLSNLLERLAARQLIYYIRDANLLPLFQSGFRPLHSTETAVLKVLSDLLEALDRGDVGALLLDLLAIFDTVDHARYYGDSSGRLACLAMFFAGCHPIFLNVTTSRGSERTALR